MTKNPNAIKNPFKWVFYVSMVALPVLHFVLFYVYVNFNSFLMAFQGYDYETATYVFNQFANFKEVFGYFKTTTYMTYAFKNSLILFAFHILIGTTLSLSFSWYIFKNNFGSTFFRVVLYLPSIISSVSLVTMYKAFMDSAIVQIYNTLFNPEIPIGGIVTNGKTDFFAVLFYTMFASFGASTLMYTGTMSGISDSVIEAAQIDGITPFKEFTKIVIPMIWPTLTTFIISSCALIFMDQMNLFTFFKDGAAGDLYTVGYYLYRQIRMDTANPAAYPALSAMGMMLTLITIPFVFAVRWFMNRINPVGERR